MGKHVFLNRRRALRVPKNKCHCIPPLSLKRTDVTRNSSSLSCVAGHAMKSTWLELGVVRDLSSDKSVPQRELMWESVPPCLSAVMRSPSRSPRRVSWFQHHKMLAASCQYISCLAWGKRQYWGSKWSGFKALSNKNSTFEWLFLHPRNISVRGPDDFKGWFMFHLNALMAQKAPKMNWDEILLHLSYWSGK